MKGWTVLVILTVAAWSAALSAAEPAAPATAPASLPEDRIIYPGRATDGSAVAAPSAGSGLRGLTTFFGVLALAGAGGWMLWKKRAEAGPGREGRLLAVDETRPLGNRQYLVVASYEGRKFLLGVCPGRIDLLSPLDGSSRREPPSAS
jgi:flagellar protein FliO/FliZ